MCEMSRLYEELVVVWSYDCASVVSWSLVFVGLQSRRMTNFLIANVYNYQGLQNDLRKMKKGKFDLKKMEDVVQELNSQNDNRVILW